MNISKLKIEDVVCFWIQVASNYFYKYTLSEGTITQNKANKSIRFRLKNSDELFDVVIRQIDNCYTFKSDAYDDPEEEFDISLFKGENELIFVCSDSEEQIYFHIILG